MDILPVQGSAIPCERVFSSSKETMAMRQNQISHDLMEALQILKFSLRQGVGLNFTNGMFHLDQVNELEVLAKEHVIIPEDLPTFIAMLLHVQG